MVVGRRGGAAVAARRAAGAGVPSRIETEHETLGPRWLYCEGEPELLFTENETNTRRLFGVPNAEPYVKDGINDYVVEGRKEAVNQDQVGTKMAAVYRADHRPR